MEKINQKKCPKCQSFNISNTGDKRNNGGDMGVNGKYQEPHIPIYKCGDCQERFLLEEVEG